MLKFASPCLVISVLLGYKEGKKLSSFSARRAFDDFISHSVEIFLQGPKFVFTNVRQRNQFDEFFFFFSFQIWEYHCNDKHQIDRKRIVRSPLCSLVEQILEKFVKLTLKNYLRTRSRKRLHSLRVMTKKIRENDFKNGHSLWAWWPKKFRENKGYSLWGWLTESEYKVVWGPGPSHEQHVLAPEQLPWAVKQFERSEFRQFHEFFQNLFDNSLVLQSFMKFFHKKSALLDNFFTRICSKLRRLIGRFIWHRQFCLQPIFSSKWRVAVKFVSSSLALMNQQLFQYRLLLC